MKNRVFIIAEAGVNHNGSLELAQKLVAGAAEARADAVKFQTFKTENLISRNADKAAYQKKATDSNESQFAMLKHLELREEEFRQLAAYCEQINILFLSTPFDLESVDMLNAMQMPVFKIPSGEITNLPLLRKIGSLGEKIILSTGMADITEIQAALDVLFLAGANKDKITLLHCNTEYPTPMHDVNLRAMETLSTNLGLQVGYSDHTLGIEVPVAAVALGAKVIEKHFTLDRKMEGPDHRASLEPVELKAMVRAIRNIEKALGSKGKKPTASELANRPIARKSIVAARSIAKGEAFNESNLTVKRPGIGISPMQWHTIIGKSAPKNFEQDELIIL